MKKLLKYSLAAVLAFCMLAVLFCGSRPTDAKKPVVTPTPVNEYPGPLDPPVVPLSGGNPYPGMTPTPTQQQQGEEPETPDAGIYISLGYYESNYEFDVWAATARDIPDPQNWYVVAVQAFDTPHYPGVVYMDIHMPYSHFTQNEDGTIYWFTGPLMNCDHLEPGANDHRIESATLYEFYVPRESCGNCPKTFDMFCGWLPYITSVTIW